MGVLVHHSQSVNGHVSVDLCGRKIGVTEQLLNGPEVGTTLEQVNPLRANGDIPAPRKMESVRMRTAPSGAATASKEFNRWSEGIHILNRNSPGSEGVLTLQSRRAQHLPTS